MYGRYSKAWNKKPEEDRSVNFGSPNDRVLKDSSFSDIQNTRLDSLERQDIAAKYAACMQQPYGWKPTIPDNHEERAAFFKKAVQGMQRQLGLDGPSVGAKTGADFLSVESGIPRMSWGFVPNPAVLADKTVPGLLDDGVKEAFAARNAGEKQDRVRQGGPVDGAVKDVFQPAMDFMHELKTENEKLMAENEALKKDVLSVKPVLDVVREILRLKAAVKVASDGGAATNEDFKKATQAMNKKMDELEDACDKMAQVAAGGPSPETVV